MWLAESFSVKVSLCCPWPPLRRLSSWLSLLAAGRRSFLVNVGHTLCIVPPCWSFVVASCMYLRGPHDLFLWSLSSVPSQMRVASSPAYRTDFHDWVTYGSWTSCPSCHSFQFDTDSFKNLVSYSARSRRSESICSFDFWSHQRSHIAAPPTAHSGFEPEAYYVDLADSPALKLTPPLGVSCRWWYHPLLYSPSRLFSFCTVPDGLLSV